MRINQKVCFITGTGHSGSTLLGLLLGNHSQGFYCGEGEKSRAFARKKAPIHKRSCKFCGVDCPVWGQIQINQNHDLYEQLTQHLTNNLNINVPLIIDSSSGADWVDHQRAKLANTETKIYLIFLKRDGRGVVNSYYRKYPEYGLENIIQDWKTKITKANALYEQFSGPKIILHYEDLASNVDINLQRLCEFLDLPHESGMRDFSKQTYHLLGGNNGTQFLAARHQEKFLQAMIPSNRQYYQEHQSEIILDLRWQQELSPEQLQLFDHLAGEINRSFEWH